MTTSIIRAGGTGVPGVQTTGGDDGALALKVGPLAATVEALNISSTGTGAFVGQVTATGFTGTLDGILGSGTPAAATVTTIDASGVVTATDTVGSSFNQFYALGNGNVGGIRFGNTTVTNGYIYYDNGANMNFNLGGEKMRITSAGNVGIGTASPASKLDVVTAGDNTITSRSTGGSGLFHATGVANAFTGFFINSVSTNLWSIQTRGDTNLHLYRNSGSGNVLIDNCNVGIGTASPTAELHIKAAAPEIVIQDGATDSFTSGAVSSSLSFQARNSSVRVLGQIDAIHESTNGTIGGMRFQTRTGDVLGERVRINSTGNVGIGTPGGTGKLAVLGDSINFYPSADNNSNGIGCAINGANVASAGAASARLFMSGANSAHSGNLDLRSGSVVSSTLNMFATTGTQAIFLTTNGNSYFNGGNVGIGTTVPGAKLHVSDASVCIFAGKSGTGLTTPAMQISKGDNNSTTSNVYVQFFSNGVAAGQGHINANGGSQVAFGSFSDRRLKENIVDLPPQLANILTLRPVEFDYIESEGGSHQIGFIAQDVEEVYPDLIGEREDGMLTLSDLNKNDARLIKAIQEQQATIEALTTRITALEG
jgi:hypothetical protein